VEAESAAKCSRFEQAVRDVRAKLTQAQTASTVADEERTALMGKLQAASSSLGRLRLQLDNERDATSLVEANVRELRHKEASLSQAVANSVAQLHAQGTMHSSTRELEASLLAVD